jgi:hypothetical protein
VAARILGTSAWNLRNWETGRHRIEIRFYPAILLFLGYNPLPRPTTRGEAIRRERISRGWSRKQLGLLARVDEGTIKRLELDVPRMAKRLIDRVLTRLGLNL